MTSQPAASSNQPKSETPRRRQDEAARAERQEQEEFNKRARYGERRVSLTVTVGLGLGVLASVLYSLNYSSAVRVGASALVFAIAALAAGGFSACCLACHTRSTRALSRPVKLIDRDSFQGLEQILTWSRSRTGSQKSS
jgi:hypothetical protein